MNLTAEQKFDTVPKAIKNFINDRQSNQAEVARLAKINEAYVSNILAKNTHISKSPIKDKYYEAIAMAIGLELKKQVWRHFDTTSYQQIINALKKAKTDKVRVSIDGDTGFGKTYACHKFLKDNPRDTFVVTASALENKKEFCINIAETLGVETHGTAATIIKRVIKKLTKDCATPLLIIDEAEHIKNKQGYINVIKALSDALERKCGFVISGMDINKILQQGYDRNRQNFRQTARRFANRENIIKDIKEDIMKTCNILGLTSKRLQDWFCNRMQNFGDFEIMVCAAFEESKKSGYPITTNMLNSLYI